MSRYIGNYLRVPSLEPQQSSAPGIWSISEQLAYQRNNQWPIARDPYYNQTVLHLSGNVPNTSGPQAMNLPLAYNSDASTNNFLITPNGDVHPKPFSPYMGETYSTFFDGSGDLVTVSGGMPSGQGTAFTLECWVNPSNLNDYRTITRSGGGGTLDFGIQSNGQVSLANTGVVAIATTPNGVVRAGVWTHIALTRTTGNLYTIYVNGLPCASGTNSTSMTANTTIGQHQSTASQSFSGYITNFRVCNALVYTGQFTPSDAPLTATSQGATSCQLLCLQSNRFIDNSGNNRTVTRGGDCRITDNSPFVSTDFTSGAGYFDGSGDYLTAPASNITDVSAGQAFTFECWFYTTSTAAQCLIKGEANGFLCDFSSTFIGYGKAGVGYAVNASTTITANQWNHIAVSRNTSNQSRIWLNGQSIGSSSSDNYAFSNVITYIGRESTAINHMVGYISNLRFVKGTALYDPTSASNISVSTTSLLPVANTTLLTLQTRAASQNHGFIDSSPNEFIVTRNGNVSQGTFSPFSPTGWGNYFDGTGDYLATPTGQTPLTLNTDDFTFECWYYLPTQVQANTVLISSSNSSSITNSLLVQLNTSTNAWQLFVNGTNLLVSASGRSATLNTWQHVAITRSGSTFNFFINGVAATGVSTSGASISVANWLIGYWYLAVHALTGYISNLRIVKGVVVYTGAFTPPAQPLAATQSAGPTGSNIAAITGSQTSLLTCQSNRFKDNSANNFAITTAGNVAVQAFSPFAPATQSSPLVTGGSGYFDGTTDWLSVPGSTVFNFGTGDFTIEGWFYLTSATGGYILIFELAHSGGSVFARFGDSGSYSAYLQFATTGSSASVVYSTPNNQASLLNRWTHFAFTRSSGTARVFVNGVQQSIGTGTNPSSFSATSWSDSTNVTGNTSVLVSNSGASFRGYQSGVRVLTGTALYTSSFPIPTAPPTAIPNTSLLLNFTGGGIVDATGKNNLETVGNAQVATAQSKWAPGSMYFDGTGDYIQCPISTMWDLGTGDFTIEMWVYYSTSSRNGSLVSYGGYGYASADSAGWSLQINTTYGNLTFNTGTTQNNFISSNNTLVNSTLPNGQWNHIAITRQGTNLRCFVNGTQVGSTIVNSTSLSGASYTPKIAADQAAAAGSLITGYIDDLRITKGYARYVTGTGGNAGQMVFNGTNILALPTLPFPIG